MLYKQLNYHAKQTFKALSDNYNSIVKVYPQIIDHLTDNKLYYYVGLKDTSTLSIHSIQLLLSSDIFLLHTIDKASPNGRAIDPFLMNPITTFPMTGSSSGTAMNVFLGINDLGIGTDGGGSVLAPAMALNLYGFISPLLPLQENVQNKQSTDGITFTPSAGLIAKDFPVINKTLSILQLLNKDTHSLFNPLNILEINNSLDDIVLPHSMSITNTELDTLSSRSQLIPWLEQQLKHYDYIISKEGPIDFPGLGDSIIGHFDTCTHTFQQQGNKGLIRVVNMVNATALSIPSNKLAVGWVIITQSKPNKIKELIELVKYFPVHKDELIDRYFGIS